MAFTLYTLIQTAILCTNAIAVLHEERFLSKSKYTSAGVKGGFGDDPGVKAQLLVRSICLCFFLLFFVFTVPLIIVNSACIVLLLLFG
uniref:Immediate early response 3-interacting protein 1 n=1 Tax=Lates calcarifer TaxID=8187 RepID=A0A4W6FU48_LATCA